MEPLKVSYDVSEVDKESLRVEVDQLEREYEALEDKLVLDVSWAFLYTRFETLTEASEEGFGLEAELSKAKKLLRLLSKVKVSPHS